MEEAK